MPFLLHGDAAWSLIVQLSLGETKRYLDVRRGQGFNALVVNLIEHRYADDAPQNANGDAPFRLRPDFGMPNPAYFDHAERVIEAARERGFLVLLAPAYLGSDGGDEGWYSEMLRSGAPTLQRYGEFLGERFARFDNIIWLDGGDYLPPPQGLLLVDAVAQGIRSVAPHQLHTTHWHRNTTSMDHPFPWVDIDTVYTDDVTYPLSLEEYRRPDRIPQILIESDYEEEHESTPQSLRAQAYHALLAGSVGEVYGHGDVWQFAPAWEDALDAPGVAGMRNLYILFSDLSWYDLVPDLDGRFLVEGSGSFGTVDYAIAAATAEHDLGLVYIPSERTVTLDLGEFGSRHTARFYDPSNGRFHAAEGVRSSTGRAAFSTPGQNAAGESDWVLVVQRERV